jgi:hypothetical protein
MKATKILSGDIADMKISALPSRPTAPTSFGGKGFTALQMKEAFDRLPLFIIEKFNTLIEDIGRSDSDSLAAAMLTGIADGHTLAELFSDITDGDAAQYLMIGNESLSAFSERISNLLKQHASSISTALSKLSDTVADGGRPSSRDSGGYVI